MNPITRDGVYVEISMNPNDQYRFWTFVFLIRLTEQSIKLPSERIQHPSKKHLRAGSSMTHCKKPLHSRTKEDRF